MTKLLDKKQFISSILRNMIKKQLYYWNPKSLVNFAPKFMKLSGTNNWIKFQELFKNKQIDPEILKEIYNEFKDIYLDPLSYFNALHKVKGGYIGGTKQITTDKPVDNDNNTDDCWGYYFKRSMDRPYVVDDKDYIWSIHESDNCTGAKEISGNFQICPNWSKERDIVLISGPSGAGKSFLAEEYIKKYKKIYPTNKIILISNKPFEKLKITYTKLPLEESYVNNLKVNNFQNSLIIFDDVENISSNEIIQNKIIKFLEEVLNVGRSMHISIIIISHILMNYRFSRNMIMEANKIIIFPNSGVKYQYSKFLNNYIGLDKKTSNDILDTRSRWLCIDKESPITIITRNKVKILS